MINLQLATFLGLIFILTFQSQAQFTRLTDLSPGSSDSAKISDDFVLASGELFFTAIQPEYGRELWKTDANSGGASLVRDINSGTSGTEYKALTIFNNKLYFFAQNHLWSSEGMHENTIVIDSLAYGYSLTEYKKS